MALTPECSLLYDADGPMHVCANTHTCMPTWVYIDTFAHADTHTHAIYMHAHVQGHTHGGTHRHTQTHHTHSCTHVQTPTTCTHVCARRHTQIHLHIHVAHSHDTHTPLGPEAPWRAVGEHHDGAEGPEKPAHPSPSYQRCTCIKRAHFKTPRGKAQNTASVLGPLAGDPE